MSDAKMDRASSQGDRREEALAAVQGAHRAASRELSHGGRRAGAVPDALRADRRATALLSMFEDLADLFEQGAADGTPIREIVGEDPVEFAEAFLAELPGGPVDRPGAGTADQRHRSRRGDEP